MSNFLHTEFGESDQFLSLLLCCFFLTILRRNQSFNKKLWFTLVFFEDLTRISAQLEQFPKIFLDQWIA